MNAVSMISATRPDGKFGQVFWERLWRSAGIQSVSLFVVAYFVYGIQPNIAAAPEALGAFYGSGRAHILVGAAIVGLAILNMTWFLAALRSTLADAGQDGWGAAVTASSAAVGAVLLILIMLCAALTFPISASGDLTLASSLNTVVWAGLVMSSFPRAMLIMSGSFGLWRAGIISDRLFGVCVAAVVLVLAGGTTWMNDGIWSPDGAYARLISPLIGLVWLAGMSGLLLTRRPATRSGW